MDSMTDTVVGSAYRSAWTDMVHMPFTYGWIDVNGVKTRYLQAGNPQAPALLMLHGTSGTLETFTGNLPPHALHFNCVAFDMLGSGFSDKPDYDYEIPNYVAHTLGLMDALGIKTASFIGVSLGAWIAAKFAVDHPERTNKLILISTPGLFNSVTTQGKAQAERTNAVANPTSDVVRGVLTKLVRNPAKITGDMIAIRQANYMAPGAVETMAHVMVLQNPEVRERNNIPEKDWKSIMAPTLIIASVDDKNIWLDTAYALEKLIPNVKLFEMHDVNHWPHFEEPELFNALSIEFLRND